MTAKALRHTVLQCRELGAISLEVPRVRQSWTSAPICSVRQSTYLPGQEYRPCKQPVPALTQEHRPSSRGQQDGAAIPLPTVEADVREEIGEVERMAHQPIRSRLSQATQGRANAEPPAKGEETRQTQPRRDHHQELPKLGPGKGARHNTEVEDLRIGVCVGHKAGQGSTPGVVLRSGRTLGECDAKNNRPLAKVIWVASTLSASFQK